MKIRIEVSLLQVLQNVNSAADAAQSILLVNSDLPGCRMPAWE